MVVTVAMAGQHQNAVRTDVMIAVKQHFLPVPVERVVPAAVPAVESFFLQIRMHLLPEFFPQKEEAVEPVGRVETVFHVTILLLFAVRNH